jgi:histidinol phosphatase-like enzyme (inositol monophosphatase family)
MSLLLEAAAEVARIAGDTALRYFRGGITVETKRDGTPVTVADRAAETIAREWLGNRFPEDGILGEELGEERPGARRRWLLDPIDGTKTFVRGVPLWGSMVALHEGETILVGAVYCPAVNELVVAAPGEGCWWNGSRCTVSTIADLSAATVLTTDERFGDHPERASAWRDLAARTAVSRTWGDCYGYLLVATGRAELMTDPVLSPWDAAALLPMITEAGGIFTDWRGGVTAFERAGVVATNAALADEIRSFLGVGASSLARNE